MTDKNNIINYVSLGLIFSGIILIAPLVISSVDGSINSTVAGAIAEKASIAMLDATFLSFTLIPVAFILIGVKLSPAKNSFGGIAETIKKLIKSLWASLGVLLVLLVLIIYHIYLYLVMGVVLGG